MPDSDPTIRTTISLRKSEHERLVEISKKHGLSVSYLLVSSALGSEHLAKILRDKFRITVTNIGWDKIIECCISFTGDNVSNEITVIMKRVQGLYIIDGNVDDVNNVLGFIDNLKSKGGKIEGFILP
jgi:hypothetical protein